VPNANASAILEELSKLREGDEAQVCQLSQQLQHIVHHQAEPGAAVLPKHLLSLCHGAVLPDGLSTSVASSLRRTESPGRHMQTHNFGAIRYFVSMTGMRTLLLN
jgi:hypothetical protein